MHTRDRYRCGICCGICLIGGINYIGLNYLMLKRTITAIMMFKATGTQ